MKANFLNPCLPLILKWEGGNDDDPDDPGGRTSRGVEQREYNAYCSIHGITRGDVWQMPQVICTAIYQTSYWNPYCDLLPSGLDLMFFDTNVNEGVHEGIMMLQRALNVDDDGHFGIITAAAVKDLTDVKGAISKIAAERRAAYLAIAKKRPRSKKFLHGWLDRDQECLAASLHMVT